MEKILRKTLVILIYIGLILINTKAYATQTANPIKDNVRMRKEASTESSVVETLKSSNEVTILDKQDNWYKVEAKVDDKTLTGFIREDLLNINEEKEQENKESNSNNQENQDKETENTVSKSDEKADNIKIGYTAKAESNLQIKLVPTINSESIEEINKGTEYKVIEVLNKWCHIETENRSGWIFKSKLEGSTVTENEQQESSQVPENEEVNDNEDDKEENNIDSPKQEEDNKEEKESEKNEKDEEQKSDVEEQENVSKEVKNETKYVSVDTLNVREKASSNSKVIDQLDLNDKITVLEIVDDSWARIEKNGKTGYVSTKFLSDKKTEITSRSGETSREKVESNNSVESAETQESISESKSNESEQKEQVKEDNQNSSSKSGSSVVEYAKQYLGYKYVSGGASPSTGFDCSGFTTYVFKHFGVSLSRTSGGQASNGTYVEKSDLQLGDILIFNDSANSKVGHVGIYIGGNQFIHAANPKKGVVITSLSDSYYSARYVSARRVI